MLCRTGVVHLKPYTIQTERVRNADHGGIGCIIKEKERDKIEKEQ